MERLKALIRDVPDFPKPGILFRDITTLLKDGRRFQEAIDTMVALVDTLGPVDLVIGIESRGFVLGTPLALRLGSGFVPVRKKGKLPAKTYRVTYDLEYGTDTLEMHQDAVTAGARVLIADDLLATGGTAAATARLVEQAGGIVAGMVFLIELSDLHGRERLKPYEVRAAITY